MDTTIIEGRSISKPPYFDGTNCTEWKEHIKIFIQSVDFDLWLVIKNGPKIPKIMIDGVELVKSEDQFNDEDKKIMEQDAKAKNILCCALNPYDLKRISRRRTAKEMWEELDREEPTFHVIYSATLVSRAQTPAQVLVLPNIANLEFMVKSDDDEKKRFLKLCVPIHKHALNGNWPAAKRIIEKENKLKNAAITIGSPTLLHIAAGANHFHFVKELLKMLDDNDITLQDMNGNTAFCFAAAAGNIEIVDLLLDRNSQLPVKRGGNGNTPIQYAALQGRCKMTWHLYDKTTHCFEDADWDSLFFACIYTRIYDLALKMVRDRNDLAFAHNENEETALHLLDQYRPEHDPTSPIMTNRPRMRNPVVFQLVEFLWTTILVGQYSKLELNEIINQYSQLISVYPSMILRIAVLHRHVGIFNLVHQIAHMKGITLTYEDDERNTLLHLAAKLAPRGHLELVSGAPFQMCLEILWFEKIKKIMLPAQIKMRNSEGFTAQELFSNEHEKLRENAELWMKKTAESCMLISTVIATGVFAAATNLLSSTNDDIGKPNYLKKTSFSVFAISDASAFISSSIAILTFLSILVSRYGEYDFYKSLPLKLIFGLISLFISITSMMVAFSSSFFKIYHHGSMWIPSFVSILSFLPILLYIGLQFSLFSDIIYSTYYWWILSKPAIKMISVPGN